MARTLPILGLAWVAAVGVGLVDPRLILLVVLPAWWALVRAHRMSVSAGARGLTVRNPWRTTTVPWAGVTDPRVERTRFHVVPVVAGIRVWALAAPRDGTAPAEVLGAWRARYA
jgi:hypothetical protein